MVLAPTPIWFDEPDLVLDYKLGSLRQLQTINQWEDNALLEVQTRVAEGDPAVHAPATPVRGTP